MGGYRRGQLVPVLQWWGMSMLAPARRTCAVPDITVYVSVPASMDAICTPGCTGGARLAPTGMV